jgi:myo-inositol catabolism protein IolS
MLYRSFGKLGWQISTVGMGTWNIGNQWGEIDDATAIATVQAAFDNGVNLFDTAEGYGIPQGLSEERLGAALSCIRNQVYIVSKVGSWGRRNGSAIPLNSVDNIRLCVQASLFRLQSDWIDVMLCHEGEIADPSIYLEGFEALKQQGLIQAYGISTNEYEVLKRFNANGTCSVVELDYSLLNRKPESKLLPYCQEHGIAVLGRGPLGKGLLSGKYAADTVFTDGIRSRWHEKDHRQQKLQQQMAMVAALKSAVPTDRDLTTAALQYVISHPVQPVAIPGAKSPEQAAINAKAGNQYLTVAERQQLITCLERFAKSRESGEAPAETPGAADENVLIKAS